MHGISQLGSNYPYSKYSLLILCTRMFMTASSMNSRKRHSNPITNSNIDMFLIEPLSSSSFGEGLSFSFSDSFLIPPFQEPQVKFNQRHGPECLCQSVRIERADSVTESIETFPNRRCSTKLATWTLVSTAYTLFYP